MKRPFSALNLPVAFLVVASLACVAFAQDETETVVVHPRYAVLHHDLDKDTAPPPASLPLWTGSYKYSGQTYKYTMVGTTPSTGTSTTVPVYIIPLKMVFNGGKSTFNAEHTLSNGLTVVKNTIASPIFQDMDWVSPEGTDLGTTQYEDAFQRGNFWGTVSAAPGYHVRLGAPIVKALQTIDVPTTDGSVASIFGVTVGIADINWFDPKIEAMLTSLKIPANSLPIFITYNVYLSGDSGLTGCCIGGYHSYTGLQAYAQFSYIGKPGAFAEDVAALSHEAGEWLDDPLTNNTNVPVLCGILGNGQQVLEVGDPEEVDANYGTFPYTLNGFTYHLQDLTYLEYFGAPKTTSVDGGALTFHDNPFGLTVCSNGG